MIEAQERANVSGGFSTAITQLRSAQKSAKGAPIYSLYVNRPLGRVLAAAAFQMGLTPNRVTAISAVFTFSGVALLALAPPSALAGFAVGLLLILGYAFDAADGQLARLRGGGSLLGEWLDHLTDSVKVVVVHLAVAVCWWRGFALEPVWLLVPLVFAAASSVHFFGMVLIDLLTRVQSAASGRRAPRAQESSRLRSCAKLPTDYGVLCLAFLLLGWHDGFVAVYSLLALAMLGYTVLVVRKWRDDVATLEDRER